jgi:hypothetical protein
MEDEHRFLFPCFYFRSTNSKKNVFDHKNNKEASRWFT